MESWPNVSLCGQGRQGTRWVCLAQAQSESGRMAPMERRIHPLALLSGRLLVGTWRKFVAVCGLTKSRTASLASFVCDGVSTDPFFLGVHLSCFLAV